MPSTESSRPDDVFLIERHEGQSVFSLDGVRFPAIPARILGKLEPLPYTGLTITRTDGTTFAGVVHAPMDYPNGVPGAAPFFRIPELEIDRADPLLASSFAEGERVSLSEASIFLRSEILKRIEGQLAPCVDFLARLKELRRWHEENLERMRHAPGHHLTRRLTAAEMKAAVPQFLGNILVLFAEVRELPNAPAVFDILETKSA